MPPVEDAFRRSLLALLPRLRRFAYGLAGDLAEADDLVQSACVKALENRARYRDGTRLDSWLYKIIQNLWIDRQRRRRRRPLDEGGEAALAQAPASGYGAPGQTEDRLMLTAVDRALMTLPAEQRAVLLLVSVDGLAYREAAAILGLPMGTVMSRLARARLALADKLDLNDRARAQDETR
jgi:RNA polymerase sigma-70 factor (ECF subfamily)